MPLSEVTYFQKKDNENIIKINKGGTNMTYNIATIIEECKSGTAEFRVNLSTPDFKEAQERCIKYTELSKPLEQNISCAAAYLARVVAREVGGDFSIEVLSFLEKFDEDGSRDFDDLYFTINGTLFMSKDSIREDFTTVDTDERHENFIIDCLQTRNEEAKKIYQLNIALHDRQAGSPFGK